MGTKSVYVHQYRNLESIGCTWGQSLSMCTSTETLKVTWAVHGHKICCTCYFTMLTMHANLELKNLHHKNALNGLNFNLQSTQFYSTIEHIYKNLLLPLNHYTSFHPFHHPMQFSICSQWLSMTTYHKLDLSPKINKSSHPLLSL